MERGLPLSTDRLAGGLPTSLRQSSRHMPDITRTEADKVVHGRGHTSCDVAVCSPTSGGVSSKPFVYRTRNSGGTVGDEPPGES